MQTENTYVETDLGNIALNPRGEYSDEVSYEYLDTVSYKGGSYMCLAELGKSISGIAPVQGKNTEHWQMLTMPGGLTSDYIAMHDDVVNKTKQVEDAQADVSQMRQDTQDASQMAIASRDSAAGYAQSAEISRTAAKESEDNVKAQESKVIQSVIEEGTKQIKAVSNKAMEQIGAVNTTGSKQVSTIETKGADQVKAIQKAGENALQNISDGVDKGLSEEGKAADAKATGEAISKLTEDLSNLSRAEYVDILASPDVVSIKAINRFPYLEHSAEQIKTVDMSVISEASCELNIVFKAKAARKYLLSAVVRCTSGNGKIMLLDYNFAERHSIYALFKDSVKWNDNLINNVSTNNQNMLIALIGETSIDSEVIARLRIESNDKTLIADYSQMSLVDITDIYDVTAINKYVNMSYNERFDLKPKGISAEAKNKLEANLTESKEYTDTKLETEGHKSNYLYGKKWWAVGDSITYGARSDIDQNGVRKTYATYIADRNGMDLKLDAISGRAMGIKDGRTDSFCMNGYYNNCPFDYPDYITIFLGTNDTEEVGTIDSVDINTFAGAYNKVLDYLTMTYPRTKIGIIPVYNLAESRGKITIALGEKWGVPVFNWDTHSFFYYRYQKNTVMERKQKEFMHFDGTRYEVHPNDTGYQFMSTMIESWMREL